MKKPKKISKISNTDPIKLYVVGGILILGTFLLGYSFSKTNTNSQPQVIARPVSVQVDVPTRPLAKGQKISSVPFTKIEWPSTSDISQYYNVANDKGDFFTSQTFSAFSPIPKGALTKSSSDANAVVEGIPPGYRAITVRVDVESIVEGWAQAGNFVDVIVLRQSVDADLGIEAKVIAENVKILSAGASVETQSGNPNNTEAPPTVTLLVTQEDALKIRTAVTIGKLTFALRGVGDESPTLSVSMNQKSLLGDAKSPSKIKRDSFKGMARGPDGKMYVLDSDSQWVKDIKESNSQAANNAK